MSKGKTKTKPKEGPKKPKESPEAAMMENMPPEIAQRLAERAYRDAVKTDDVPLEEVVEWLETLEGLSFTIWLSLEKRYPGEFTPGGCLEVLNSLTDKQVEELKDQQAAISGTDAAGNPSGSQGTATATTATPSEHEKGESTSG